MFPKVFDSTIAIASFPSKHFDSSVVLKINFLLKMPEWHFSKFLSAFYCNFNHNLLHRNLGFCEFTKKIQAAIGADSCLSKDCSLMERLSKKKYNKIKQTHFHFCFTPYSLVINFLYF